MIKNLALALILTLATVSLVGCGSNTNNTQPLEVTEENESISEVDLQAMVDYITSNVEWASLMQIDDPDLISEYFTLDATNPNYKQLLVSQCPMSAVIAEIILIQAEDVQSAKDDLNARRDKLINTDAYYPEHKEIAEESIIGNVGDIVYFIAGENAQESEDVLVEYLNQ
jgi:hypothetical protein